MAFTYNTQGQVLTVTTPPRAGITEDRTATFTYDSNGRVESVAGPPGSTTPYTYDGYGRGRTLTDSLRENGLRDLRHVQERHLAAFARRLRERTGPHGTPLAVNTQAAYLQRVRSFFDFLVRRGLLLVDPAQALGVPAASPLPRTVLSPRQAERLMNAPSPWSAIGQRDRAILETFYGTGLRRGECARLDVSDVDLREGTLPYAGSFSPPGAAGG